MAPCQTNECLGGELSPFSHVVVCVLWVWQNVNVLGDLQLIDVY